MVFNYLSLVLFFMMLLVVLWLGMFFMVVSWLIVKAIDKFAENLGMKLFVMLGLMVLLMLLNDACSLMPIMRRLILGLLDLMLGLLPDSMIIMVEINLVMQCTFNRLRFLLGLFRHILFQMRDHVLY